MAKKATKKRKPLFGIRESAPKKAETGGKRSMDPRKYAGRMGSTYDDRLRDGFRMMRESGDGY